MNLRACRVVAAIFALAVAASLGAAERPREVVRMSPYEVSANSIDFRNWIKVATPHYIIYTDTDFIEASGVLRELELLHLALQVFFGRPAGHGPPTVLVLPTSRSDWHKIASKGAVDWQVALSAPTEDLFQLILVHYEWQKSGLGLVRAGQAGPLLEAMNLNGPFWFTRGVSRFMETAQFSGDAVTLGRMSARVGNLVEHGWLPWPRFFRLTEKSPEFTRDGTDRFRLDGQAAIFMQHMLTHPDPVWVDRLLQWAAITDAQEEPGEAAFEAVFAQDWKAWQASMDRYLTEGSYQTATWRMPAGFQLPAPARLELPVPEMRELFILSQILNQRVAASTLSLDTLLAKGLKTEALREMLAEACFRRDRPEAGQAELAKLAAGGAQNPAVYAVAALEIFKRHMPEPSLHARVPEAAAAEIRSLCEKALQLSPEHAKSANLLAQAIAFGPAADGENAAAIEKIYHRAKGHFSTSTVLTALAVARWRAGQAAPARAVSRALLDSPYADKQAKAIAAALMLELDKAP